MRFAMKLSTMLLPVILSWALAGCQDRQPLGRDFGNAVRHNMSVHIINPAPDYAGRKSPGLDGIRAADVLERYQKGRVIKPKAVSTTSSGGGK